MTEPEVAPREQQQWLKRVSSVYEDQRDELLAVLNDNSNKSTVYVAGFPISVANTGTGTKKVQKMKRKIVEEVEASSAIKKKLAIAGITPIGVLPKDIFASIVEKTGLYTFSHITKEGKVPANGRNFSEKYRSGNKEILLYGAFLLDAIIKILPTSLYFFARNADGPSSLASAAGFALLVAAAILGGTLMDAKGDEEWYKRTLIAFAIVSPLSMIMRYFYKKRILQNAKKYLWPEKHDNIEERNQSFFEIVLPTPPASIQKMLFACHKNDVKTFLVVDQDAFDVVLDNQTLSAVKKQYPTDPIIVHEYKEMVAVLGQFGNFEGEKEVIQYVRDHFAGITKDLIIQKN